MVLWPRKPTTQKDPSEKEHDLKEIWDFTDSSAAAMKRRSMKCNSSSPTQIIRYSPLGISLEQVSDNP